jgi:hypothetical protein
MDGAWLESSGKTVEAGHNATVSGFAQWLKGVNCVCVCVMSFSDVEDILRRAYLRVHPFLLVVGAGED